MSPPSRRCRRPTNRWANLYQVRLLSQVDVLVAPHAWPLLPIAALFLPKGAAVIEVSSTGTAVMGAQDLLIAAPDARALRRRGLLNHIDDKVSPSRSTRIGSPLYGHAADGLGLQHCLTGSLEATGAFDEDHRMR